MSGFDEAISIEDLARRIGGYVWVERHLFEVFGRWSTLETDPALRVQWSIRSRRHGWHSGLWMERAPALAHMPISDLVRCPTAMAETLAAMASLDNAMDGAARVALIEDRVLPTVRERYRWHAERCDARVDGPTRWVLDIVGRDPDRFLTDLVTG